jgi:diguanylate cyclase (GGDEF)-like protein
MAALYAMNDSNYLILSDLDDGQQLQALVRPLCSSALCAGSGHLPSSVELRKATLILVSEADPNLAMVLDHHALPPSTPILVLGSGGGIPSAALRSRERRLIDYLRVPVSQLILEQRLSFLSKVQRMSSEHHANATTLDRQLNALSSRDGLTGLFNRRHLTGNLKTFMEEASNSGEDLCLLLFNIDFFNAVNKSSGQQYGDFILNEMAARLKMAARPEDGCYRFSGEDFVVLMPKIALEEAKKRSEKIRRACIDKPYAHGETSQSITVSMGLASLKGHNPNSHDDFITMAETALFLAKAQGRNRLRTYRPLSGSGQVNPHQSMVFLKDTLSRILEKTKTSAVASVQLLARHVAGPEHQQHAATVSNYITLLGRQLGLVESHLETFHNVTALCSSFRSLLHNNLISKPQLLSAEERSVMRDLPFKLIELTDMFDYFANEREVLLSYAERYDGTGHPQGLKGDEIPLAARIFSLIDALAAMVADRPHRRRLSSEEIVTELQQQAGKQFDPSLVLHIFQVIEENHLLDLDRQVIDKARRAISLNFPHLCP